MARAIRRPGEGITVRPIGGLGNQLFIYATGYALARRRSSPLYIDDSWFATQSLRTFELDSFARAGTVMSGRWRTRPAPRSRFARLRERIRVAAGDVDPRMWREYSFRFQEPVLSAPSGVCLDGYFQSYKYFEDAGEDLRRQVLNISQPTDWFLRTAADLREANPWIAVHVRRGDYTQPGTRQYHGLLGRDYYSRALSLLRQLVGDRDVVVFSDDVDEARALLRGLSPTAAFLTPPAESQGIESLALMAGASAAVIANSSFSWWGAWLGDQPSRPVIAPRPWFNDINTDERDLFPHAWLTVGRE